MRPCLNCAGVADPRKAILNRERSSMFRVIASLLMVVVLGGSQCPVKGPWSGATAQKWTVTVTGQNSLDADLTSTSTLTIEAKGSQSRPVSGLKVELSTT